MFSHPVMSDSLQPHVLHHTRPLCFSSSPKVYQVHVHFISAIQPSHPLTPSSPSALIFPCIRSFSNEPAVCIRWPKYWRFSFSISPSNKYSGFPLRLTGLISLLSKGSQESYPAPQFKGINSLDLLSQLHMITGKTIGNISQHNKGHVWQTHSKHHSQQWQMESISSKIRNKTRVSILPLLLNIVLEVLAKTII